ncbi:MAG: 16S rRNA (cytosine(1402)-N(4))-methyltransferase, partial [Candidatus Methanosuratus sp.]|nr:16S rRNA (cytosine(1402)-N(4))-methyltransferase [Candidatus Methanosuratincola sp.]
METGTGAPPPHRPVLYQEIIQYLAPFSPGCYLDCTAGAGGHAKGILEASAPDGQLVAVDIDPDAIALARATLAPFGPRAIVKHASYTECAQVLAELGWQGVDGIVLDLGVSSMQLDRADRGFSFQQNGPLDMRFDPTRGPSAADLVNNLDEKALADLIWH